MELPVSSRIRGVLTSLNGEVLNCSRPAIPMGVMSVLTRQLHYTHYTLSDCSKSNEAV